MFVIQGGEDVARGDLDVDHVVIVDVFGMGGLGLFGLF